MKNKKCHHLYLKGKRGPICLCMLQERPPGNNVFINPKKDCVKCFWKNRDDKFQYGKPSKDFI
ncbi:MAG: hypothetical protein PHS34_08835 [Candidatus Omnitrophica bacterium]|nr:hypothetical protein [Candidatus Omnitrophota bacterium]